MKAPLADKPKDNSNPAIRIFSELLAGVLCYGGLGWLGDKFFHTGFLLPIGCIFGIAVSLYIVIKRHR